MSAALALCAVAPVACSGDSTCEGVEVAGQCQKPCDPAQCTVPGSKCFDNACAQPCNGGIAECPLGTWCATVAFPDQTQGAHCVQYPFAKGGSSKTGQDEPCKSNDDCDVHRGWECVDGTCQSLNRRYEACETSTQCDEEAGFLCVDGECRIAGCRTHHDCAVLGDCQTGTTDTGATVQACVKGTTYPPGQFGSKCPGGSDAGECDEANGFVCIGAGPGDIDAYCTATGCQADTDCATGYFCASVRTSRPPCQNACNGFTGQPSNANCVPPDDIGAGKEFSCGPLTLLRNLCLKREFCNECNTDADCLGLPGQICSADSGGRKICTTVCDPNTNSCPWGNAATCDDWDKDGVFTCSHRNPTGCVGTGKSCEPCLDDLDCPNGLCLQSDFTQERYCVDLSASCSCAGLQTEQNVYCQGGGCPQTPGGLAMHCYGGSQVQASGSPLYNKCVGANVNPNPLSSPQTGCWP